MRTKHVEKFDYTNVDSDSFGTAIGINGEIFEKVVTDVNKVISTSTKKSHLVKTLDENFSKAEILLALVGVMDTTKRKIEQLMLGGGGLGGFLDMLGGMKK